MRNERQLMANRPIVIEITPGDEPHIRFKGGNGEIMVASETYQGGADKAEQTVTKIVEEIQAGNFIIQVGSVRYDVGSLTAPS
jgi:uncharacterized protein YegP (UPF0339 family)